MIIGGELNARIGHLGAMKEEEESSTKDSITDEEEERWIELLNTYGIELLNGNAPGDLEGNYTRLGYKHQEEAILDYAGIAGKHSTTSKVSVLGAKGTQTISHSN